MCLITFAYRAHPRFELVFAANRDEFHRRPSRAAAFWPEAPPLLAGRDEEQGGTWCGITRQGRIAAVTNYRDPSTADPGKASRGLLVRDFLLDVKPTRDAIRQIETNKSAYSEFNLLAGDGEALYYVGSRSAGPTAIKPGLHAISNGLIDTPWPKMKRSSAALEKLLATDDISPESLFVLLSSKERAVDSELPDTGIGLEMERFLSAVFIQSETYGTRSSTVILVDKYRNVRFCERRFNPAGICTGHSDEQFEFA